MTNLGRGNVKFSVETAASLELDRQKVPWKVAIISQKPFLSEEMLNGLPWEKGWYSFILGQEEEIIDDAPSVPPARDLLMMLQMKLDGLSLKDSVVIGHYKYMLVHHTIVRVHLDTGNPMMTSEDWRPQFVDNYDNLTSERGGIPKQSRV